MLRPVNLEAQLNCMSSAKRQLLSGDEAIALAARDAGVALGAGYPGTPSTEILERFSELGGRGQWSPNEKVALEVALGAAFAGARAHGDDETRRPERGRRSACSPRPTPASPAGW